jgi:hypothetical protein
MSPPEKIFEVFAMHKKAGHIYMSHSDLFQAVCPYNYTTKPRDYSHDHEHEEVCLFFESHFQFLIVRFRHNLKYK